MLIRGILNPAVNELLSRVRHTNYLVIADRGFPCFPQLEIVDLTLIDDIPTVADVLEAIGKNFDIGAIWMSDSFDAENAPSEKKERLQSLLRQFQVHSEPHDHLKQRTTRAIGIIRTADTLRYSNIVLEST